MKRPRKSYMFDFGMEFATEFEGDGFLTSPRYWMIEFCDHDSCLVIEPFPVCQGSGFDNEVRAFKQCTC